jgi:protein-disulfide isomerase
MRSARALLPLLLVAPWLPACEGKGTPAPAAGDADAAGAAQACEDFGRKICDQATEGSPTCEAVKKTAALLSDKACAAALADVETSLAKLAEAGKSCTDLMTRLCADLGEDTQTCKMVKDQTPRMGPEQCDKMTAEYDQVIEELRRMEERNKPLSSEKVAMIAGDGAPAFGPEDAAVTIVEFSDFQCPYCKGAADAVTEIKKKYGDKTRFVFRQFPLGFHAQAHLAAQASLAAHAQGKFWEYHDLLFANQQALGRADLEKYAAQLGLDVRAFRSALDDGTYKKTVDDEMAMGGQVFVDGTPTMFVNGERVANATDLATISQAIEAALAKAG